MICNGNLATLFPSPFPHNPVHSWIGTSYQIIIHSDNVGKNLVLILKFVDFYKWATCIHYSSGIIQYYTQIN